MLEQESFNDERLEFGPFTNEQNCETLSDGDVEKGTLASGGPMVVMSS